jgi:hypothetical protein
MTKAFLVLDLNDTNSYTNDVNVVGIYSSMLNAGKAKQRAMAKAIDDGIEDNSTIGFFEKNLIIKEIVLDQMP